MSGGTNHADNIQGLKDLRADLVAQRREAVGKHGKLNAKAVASSVEQWQRLIETVDRALADEAVLGSPAADAGVAPARLSRVRPKAAG